MNIEGKKPWGFSALSWRAAAWTNDLQALGAGDLISYR